MIRKVGIIFSVSIILAYFIFLGLFGEEGYLHARSMRSELEVLRKRQETLLLQVDILEQQKEQMNSQDALKDAAFRFGYQEEGEQVFYFTNDGEVEHTQQDETLLTTVETYAFKGLSKLWIALIALAFSSLFTVLWLVGANRRDRHR